MYNSSLYNVMYIAINNVNKLFSDSNFAWFSIRRNRRTLDGWEEYTLIASKAELFKFSMIPVHSYTDYDTGLSVKLVKIAIFSNTSKPYRFFIIDINPRLIFNVLVGECLIEDYDIIWENVIDHGVPKDLGSKDADKRN